MEALAKLKHLKGSPRKARLVIDLIRGRNVSLKLCAPQLRTRRFRRKRTILRLIRMICL
jgi:ribosomal protein L22